MVSAWPVTALIFSGLWCTQAAAQVVSLVLQGPDRDFGRFVGDLLTSTAIVTVQPGTLLDMAALPQIGPASAIADVRRVVVGGTQRRLEIRVTYQNFFSPEQVSQAEMPGYTIVLLAHGTRFSTAVPGFAFTASAFRHDLQASMDPAAMRPDHAAMPVRAPGAAVSAYGAALVAAGLLALIGTWPVASSRRPFAAAAAQLTRLARGPKRNGECDMNRETLLVLHRAFDATAGRRVFAEDIDDFLLHHPRLTPLRNRIELFFAASRQLFFGEGGEAADASAWFGLCRDLARAERLG